MAICTCILWQQTAKIQLRKWPRLLKQWEEIDVINGNSDGNFLILKGVECDILEDGRMDIADECLEQAEFPT